MRLEASLKSPGVFLLIGSLIFFLNCYESIKLSDYDIVNVRVISKRSTASNEEKRSNYGTDKSVHLRAFGKDINLNLRPNNEFNDRIKKMKYFTASTNNGKLNVNEESLSQFNELEPYHDESNMAAVVIYHDDKGRIQMDGTIGNDLVIKPLSSKAKESKTAAFNDHDDDEMFLDEDDNNNSNDKMSAKSSENNETYTPKNVHSYHIPKNLDGGHELNNHIIYRRNKIQNEHESDYVELEPSTNYQSYKQIIGYNKTSHNDDDHSHHRRSKRQAPETVWPEVLLLVDYDSYLLHGGNSRDVKKYFISFWNGVDLRYRLLNQPAIRVSLAGMIVAKDRDATPYLERNRLRAPNADAVDAAGALTDLGKYLYREDRLPTYDLAVVITKLDMCRRRYEGGRCNRGTAGFAYVGGACVVNKRLEKVNSVAIIEDSGGFSGIIVAAHEVGHLLGCVHDGSPPPSYLGGPGATRCPWEDGFIMSDLRHTERGFRWSTCSVEQFKHFLNGETATCLYNYPHENQLLPRVLPGTMLTLDEQCNRDRGTKACFKDARVCAQLFCFDNASGYCVSYRPAAEGSPCGDGQVCRNGKCAAELENIIPDYTHVTSTISRSISRSDNSGTIVPRRSAHSRFLNRQGYLRPAPKAVDDRTADLNIDNIERRRDDVVIERRKSSDSLETCRDIVENIGGSMSCPQFLEKYSYRYCNHNYVKTHCCASHSTICT